MKIWKIAESENEKYYALQVLRRLNLERGKLKIDLLRSSITPSEKGTINNRIAYIDQQKEKIIERYNFKLPAIDKRQDWEKPVDWGKVNWDEEDEAISKQTGKSLLSIKRMRKRLER